MIDFFAVEVVVCADLEALLATEAVVRNPASPPNERENTIPAGLARDEAMKLLANDHACVGTAQANVGNCRCPSLVD